MIPNWVLTLGTVVIMLLVIAGLVLSLKWIHCASVETTSIDSNTNSSVKTTKDKR